MTITGSTGSGDPTSTPPGTRADTSQHTENGVMARVRDRAAAQLSAQKDRATDGLGSVAQAVRQSTHQLRDQQHATIAGYVERAADQIDRVSQRLREKDLSELLDDAQRLARRNPTIFIGSAFALGLIGARFMKSSPRADYETLVPPPEWKQSGGAAGRTANLPAGYSAGAGSGYPSSTTGYDPDRNREVAGASPSPDEAASPRGSARSPGTPGTAASTGTPGTTGTTSGAAGRSRPRGPGNERS